jgi:hypothetical protein
MADDTITNNTVTTNETEPATKHDVTEGGTIGLVGGAIVGALAGGPAGAVIGATAAVIGGVVGGAASAAAVNEVDKHDHDYNRTVAGTDNTITGTGAYSDYDSDFRVHHQINYAGTGAPYDEYEPAYRYGQGLATDPNYANQDWNSVESGVRSDWESRQPGTWDRFKGSVQHAYDSAKSRV